MKLVYNPVRVPLFSVSCSP